jgi:putative transposase
VILAAVRRIRQGHPRIGTLKLLDQIRPALALKQITIGRDRFFELLRRHSLLVGPAPAGPRTTDSRHVLRTYPNLLQDREITGAHQAWVSDITYIRTDVGFRYLSLVMDAGSRKVVGYNLSASLSIEGSLSALQMALRQLPADQGAALIHHSDRGVQYCSAVYTAALRARGIGISMAAVGNPYENAKAERLNGILKIEYLLDAGFRSEHLARQAVHQAIKLYNTERPHWALGLQTPEQVHAAGLTQKAA